jgi:hypothetical protein
MSKTLTVRVFLFALLVAGLAACSGAPQTVEVTRLVPQTVVVTQLVTPEPSPTPEQSPTPEATNTPPPTLTPEPVVIPTRPVYAPLEGCAPSRLHVGDRAMVTYGGGPNAIRSSADVHNPDNIIAQAEEGEIVEVIGGPECSFGWIMWLVRTSAGAEGYTPESDGTSFFLQP